MKSITRYTVSLKKKTHNLSEFYTLARDMVMWYLSAETLFWQLSIDHEMDLPNEIVKL